MNIYILSEQWLYAGQNVICWVYNGEPVKYIFNLLQGAYSSRVSPTRLLKLCPWPGQMRGGLDPVEIRKAFLARWHLIYFFLKLKT